MNSIIQWVSVAGLCASSAPLYSPFFKVAPLLHGPAGKPSGAGIDEIPPNAI